MMQLMGVIDFDILKCVILIEEKHFDSEEHSFQETPQPDTQTQLSTVQSDIPEIKNTE